jgi:type II secretory pathway pseudopilin PulG
MHTKETMNTPNIPPAVTESPGSRPLGRRRLLLIALAAFAVAVCLLYAEEHWRGKRAWENCKQRYEAQGFVLDWNRLIPPPVPDDQNVLLAPRMTEWFVRCSDQASTNDLTVRLKTPQNVPGTTDTITTDEEARRYLAWSDQFKPDFALMREALKRPRVRINGDYQWPLNLPMPNFLALRLVAQTLAQRAYCHIRFNQPEEALAELTLVNQLRRLIEPAPPTQARTLVEAMINVAIVGLYVERVAEGTSRHTWRGEDLVELKRQLDGIDLVRTVLGTIRTEPVAICYQAEHSSVVALLNVDSGFKASTLQNLIWPRGWTYQNLAVYLDVWFSTLVPANSTIAPASMKQAQQDVDRFVASRSPYRLLSAVAIPNLVKARLVTANRQSMVQQARIGCALEQYHLAHGDYPETLDALAPQFLPKITEDSVNGRPFRYHRLPGGTYQLYSIGLDGKDDGGQEVTTLPPGTPVHSVGDWPWPGSPH